MRKLDQIISEKPRYNNKNKHLEIIHETYHGVNRNIYTNDDVYEAINTAAGIDTCKRSKQCVIFQ